MTTALKVTDLAAEIDGKQILEGLSLEVPYGEVHAIMGPNGSGKSTLCHVLTGKSGYSIAGSASLEGADLFTLGVDERARLGLLQSFQYPTEIPGVRLREFMLEAAEEMGMDIPATESRIEFEADRFGMRPFLDRSLNDDLSGFWMCHSSVRRLPSSERCIRAT